MEDILKTLVQIPTITGDFAANDAGLDYIERFLRERGMHVLRQTDEGYGMLLATTRRTKTPTVALAAHLDVVPAAAEEFSLRKANGRLYGRGVRDMKCAIAAYLQLIDDLQGQLDKYNLAIVITTDEENRCHNTDVLLKDGFRPKMVILPDGGESWQLETLAKGAWFFRVSVAGNTAHGSRPWQGDSASFKLIELLGEIKALFEGHGPETSTLNIGSFKSGTTYNQIPDHAEALLDIRLASPADEVRLPTAVTALCDKYGASIATRFKAQVVKQDLSNPFLAQFARSMERITGIKNHGVAAYGGSEASRYAKYGIPCAVTYPPGDGHHGSPEWIEERSLYQLHDIIRDYVERTAKDKTRSKEVDSQPALV